MQAHFSFDAFSEIQRNFRKKIVKRMTWGSFSDVQQISKKKVRVPFVDLATS